MSILEFEFSTISYFYIQRPRFSRTERRALYIHILNLENSFDRKELIKMRKTIEYCSYYLVDPISKAPKGWPQCQSLVALKLNTKKQLEPGNFPPKLSSIKRRLNSVKRAKECFLKVIEAKKNNDLESIILASEKAKRWIARDLLPISELTYKTGDDPHSHMMVAIKILDDETRYLQKELQVNRRKNFKDPLQNRWLGTLADIWESFGFKANQGENFTKFVCIGSVATVRPCKAVTPNSAREFIQRRHSWRAHWRAAAGVV